MSATPREKIARAIAPAAWARLDAQGKGQKDRRSLELADTVLPAAAAEIAQIVWSLTSAQREAMRLSKATHYKPGGQPVVPVAFTDPWMAPVAEFMTADADALTPLGLAVRSILQAPK